MTGRGGRPADAGSPRAFAVLLAAYLVTHAGLRLVLSPVLTIDDAHETVLAQTLAWGYEPRQPPLYNWILWAGFRLLGIGPHTPALVKYAVLGCAYGFVHAASRRVIGDGRLAMLATFSLLLMVPIGWIMHEDLTHSAAVLATCAATVYALLRLEGSGRAGAYLVLGAAVGAGLLSKFTYGLFLAALTVAALTLAPLRRRLWHPRILLTLAVGAALAVPYFLWLVAGDFPLAHLYAQELRVGPARSRLAAAAAGLYYVVRVTLYYLTPLWLVLLVLFPRIYTTPREERPGTDTGGRLLERFLLCVLGLLGLGALGGGLAYLKFRWLIPAYFLLPAYAWWRLARIGVDARGLRRFAAVLLTAETLILGGLVVRVVAGGLFGRPDRMSTPYAAAADALGAAGFRGGTIVSRGPLAGNLRVSFPASRVLSADSPQYVPPETGGGQCLIAWDRQRAETPPDDIRRLLAGALNVQLDGTEPVRMAELPYRFAPDRLYRVRYVLLPEGAGRCR